jgi:hypothetical protein
MNALREYRRQIEMIKTVHSSSTELNASSPPLQLGLKIKIDEKESDDINTA